MHNLRAAKIVALLFPLVSSSTFAQDAIEEIVVTADFRERPLTDMPASVTVLVHEDIERLAVQHFEELINAIPNLNWSGDGHRARYLQIRGVGELEQYQGAPNPSVGFLIDDIDFSGIGTIATLFDIDRVEVLRGPQGTRYGANALAGLIYMRSALPTAEFGGSARVMAGGDALAAAGVAFGGPMNASGTVAGRLSLHRHSSDGFRRNTYLGRSNTNGRDESTVRGRLRFARGDDWQVDVAAVFADVDNGYDAFALDNSYTMLSDEPGSDAQRSVGASVRIEYSGLGDKTLTSISSFAASDIDFGFDADWGNAESWAPVTYAYVSSNDRARGTLSQEFRLQADDWVAGLYAMRLDDELETVNRGDYFDPFYDWADSLDDRFKSDYAATNFAAFGQYDLEPSVRTRLSAGIRFERRTTEYIDSSGLETGPSETMWGGELTLSHDLGSSASGYVTVSKGYKAGGFNLGIVPDDRREFRAEELWNLELGIKASLLDDALRINAAVFVNDRDQQQVRTSFQLIPGDPASFVFFTDNAASGDTRGFEADIRWLPNERWMLYASVGLLDASFDRFVTPQVDLSGRAQAHAPDYTLAAGGRYAHPGGFFASFDVSARDGFYFDVSHDQASDAYALAHARAGFEAETWSVTLWARNLFDAEYPVRGFFFGNEPPDFPDTLYTRLGDPRQVGVTVEKRF
jgi:outer membrane receptor protein involved in Fe transport